MGIYYIVENNRIDNSILAESEDIAMKVCATNQVIEHTEGMNIGIGYRYNEDLDKWYNPIGPFPSWTLDENYDWQPPVVKPDDLYRWNEENQEWVEIEGEE